MLASFFLYCYPTPAKDTRPFNISKIFTWSFQLSTFCAFVFGLVGLPNFCLAFWAPFAFWVAVELWNVSGRNLDLLVLKFLLFIYSTVLVWLTIMSFIKTKLYSYWFGWSFSLVHMCFGVQRKFFSSCHFREENPNQINREEWYYSVLGVGKFVDRRLW
jgi:hypothetical protein